MCKSGAYRAFFENGYKFLLYSLVCGGAIFWASVAKSDTFYSYDLLAEELSKNENANVVLDMENNDININTIDNIIKTINNNDIYINQAIEINSLLNEINNDNELNQKMNNLQLSSHVQELQFLLFLNNVKNNNLQ